MPRRKQPSIPDALFDQLLDGADPRSAFNPNGVLDAPKRALAEWMLNAEMDQHLGGEAADGRPNTRNGYGQKTVLTDTGRLALDIPRDRQGTFDLQLIAKYQRRFPGFDEKIVSMYARGMSTREIQGHIRELYGLDISPDLVSAITDAVLEEVALWQNRPLEAIYPLVFFDALRVKIRDEGLVRNKAIPIALGVRADGTKEGLGLWIEQNEGAKFWLRVMNELKNRGTEDILLAVVDGLKGFPEAIRAVFPEATVQTCIVHLLRTSLDFVSFKDRKAVASALKDIYRAADDLAAATTLDAFKAGPWGQNTLPSCRVGAAPGRPRLARSHSVLRFSYRCSPDPLHHEFHRSAERRAVPAATSPMTRPPSSCCFWCCTEPRRSGSCPHVNGQWQKPNSQSSSANALLVAGYDWEVLSDIKARKSSVGPSLALDVLCSKGCCTDQALDHRVGRIQEVCSTCGRFKIVPTP